MLKIVEVTDRRGLRDFVRFPMDLYRDCPAYVPPIVKSEVDMLDPRVNPAFEFTDHVYYLCLRDGEPAGRIAGFVNRRFNEHCGVKECRFSFVDFEDDREVSAALLDVVKVWGRERGMNTMVGPLGMTDFDPEGCLVKGFDQLSTSATIYNAPYYAAHFRAWGLKDDARWREYRMKIPDEVPEKHLRIADIVRRKYGLRVFTELNRRKMVDRWGKKIFRLLNEAYTPLYGFTPLTERQIDYYIHLYLPNVRLDCIRLVADCDDNLVAVGITCPSLSRAQQKAGGALFPFGWIHMLRALRCKGATDTWDLYLVGVRPDYQGKGVNALLFTELIPQARRNGYVWCESNPELESNVRVQSQWQYFERTCHKERVAFRTDI